MKRLTVLIALLLTQSALGAPLALKEYSASVDGSIELMTNDGNPATLISGTATIEIGRVNIVTSPLEFAMGGRKLTVKQGTNEFKFLIPAKSSKKSGSILVHREDAKQLAHIAFEETKEIVKSYEQIGVIDCDYETLGTVCSVDAQGQSSCSSQMVSHSGSQKARYLMTEYTRNIKLMIMFASKKVLLQTEALPGSQYKILEELTSCR
jgi:hypothetical protein